MNEPTVKMWTWPASLMGIVGDVFRVAEFSFGSAVDLIVRLWLAEVFLVSGVLKISHWDTALYLSRYEYPVSWLDPVVAAYLGVSIELICSVLLALGLMTRLAAIPMLILSLVIQFNYLALDLQLFWAVLFGWFVIRGPGAFSLDRVISRGLAGTALPFADTGIRVAGWITQYLGPVYQLFMRTWIAAAIIIGGLISLAGTGIATSLFEATSGVLPLMAATHFMLTPEIGLGCAVIAVILVLGVGARFVALGLIGVALSIQMANPMGVDLLYWLVIFGLIALHGAGKLSLDALVEIYLKRRFPQLDGKPAFSLDGLPRVVIVWAGFGGLACAAGLRRTPVQVTLIDRHNYHLFQPLLYQVATAGLSPGDIATPIRSIFRDYFNTRVLLGTVSGVDTTKQEVLMGEKRVAYDYLVLASGAQHSYFGKDEWGPYAPGLKKVDDATDVRRRLLVAFELAENTEDENERRALLTFVIVGGGPTGVELAGAIAELAKHGMEKEFRHFNPATARVILIQSGPRILPTFTEKLSQVAKTSLEKLGVEVLINSRVEQVDATGVSIKGNRIPTYTVLWAAGVVASPAAKWVAGEADNAGRVKVGSDLAVLGVPNVFAIGDTALSNAWNGQSVPGLAPAAKQGGQYVAKVIRARVTRRTPPAAFKYLHLGSLATIGRKAAVADFGFMRISGAPAWWLWGLIHVYFLVGLRNRVSVMFDWFWAYLTFRSGTRLITGSAPGES